MHSLLIGFSVLGILGWCLSLLEAIVALGVVIFVHELGHFMVAKLCGVKCEKFYLGFDVNGLKLWHRQWGETEYGIGIVPLGGYVKMLGQDDNPARAAEERERSKAHSKLTEHGGDLPPEPHDGETEQLDPRSYMAKSVPQRMAIISAGVIMNLIFAVIFATIAYRMGVSYIPCIAGDASGGDPAWVAGVRPGDKIIQFDDEPRDEQLRFETDLTMSVVLTGANDNLDLTVRRHNSEQVDKLTVRPTAAHVTGSDDHAIIGIAQPRSNKLASAEVLKAVDRAPAKDAKPPLLPDATIVAAKIGERTVPIADGVDLQAVLAQHPDEPITFSLETSDPNHPDAKPTAATSKVEPNPMRWLGLRLTIEPIAGIQKGSPAETAGFQKGDLIVAVDGRRDFDPLRLPDDMRKAALAGKHASIVVRRAGASSGSQEEKTLDVVPQLPQAYFGSNQAGANQNSPWTSNELGLAYKISTKIQAIDPLAADAAKHLQPGDEIVEAVIAAETDEQTKERKDVGLPDKPVTFDADHANWPYFQGLLQYCSPDLPIQVTYLRDGKKVTATLHALAAKDWFNPDRGLVLEVVSKVRQAKSWGEAVGLGWRETKESVERTVLTLRKIVSGGVSATGLGGPITIAAVAASSASEGIPKLLIFLTLLSANLAVLNFLPIPILDGGHMMFLLYEGIRGKPASERAMTALTYLGLAFILTLMLFVLGLDFLRVGKWFIHLFH